MMIECNTSSPAVTVVPINNRLSTLVDIQEQPDTRGIAIQRVGIQALEYPITILTQGGDEQSSVGLFNLSISLKSVQKGAHLSRFIEVLEAHPRKFSTDSTGLHDLLCLMQKTLRADSAFVEVSFPFFMEKLAPKTGIKSLMHYKVSFKAEKQGQTPAEIETTIQVPVTSVCPCSKAISLYGAHNQRSVLTLRLKTKNSIPLEKWIKLLEQQGSAELFALLKRPDEKWVTEHAYENAKFVEDIVRDVALLLNKEHSVIQYHITSNNLESIHNHSAYAEIFSDPR